MAKVTIVIEDREDGFVNIDSTPHFRTLVEIAKDKGRELTPAVSYAMQGIATMIKASQIQKQEEVKADFDAGLIPALPSKRPMFS